MKIEGVGRDLVVVADEGKSVGNPCIGITVWMQRYR